MKDLITKLESKVKDCNNTNTIFDTRKYLLLDDVKELLAAINYTRCCDKLPKSDIILARYLHDSYELIAKKQDWNTQENCKVDFSDLPIENKNTMIFLAGKIIQDFGGN